MKQAMSCPPIILFAFLFLLLLKWCVDKEGIVHIFLSTLQDDFIVM